MKNIQTFKNKTGVDLTDKEGYAVKFDTDGMTLCTAKTDKAVGIVESGGATESDVCIFGETKAYCGGTVTRGKHVTPTSAGKVADTSSTSTEFALALEDGIDGDVAVSVFVLGSNNAVA